MPFHTPDALKLRSHHLFEAQENLTDIIINHPTNLVSQSQLLFTITMVNSNVPDQLLYYMEKSWQKIPNNKTMPQPPTLILSDYSILAYISDSSQGSTIFGPVKSYRKICQVPGPRNLVNHSRCFCRNYVFQKIDYVISPQVCDSICT